MTDEQINHCIAEACGLKKPSRKVKLNNKGFFVTQHAKLPDYSTDLNAMHDAEKGLEDPDCYEEWLADVCGGTSYLFHATARQRAQAFLRTIGKWEGD